MKKQQFLAKVTTIMITIAMLVSFLQPTLIVNAETSDILTLEGTSAILVDADSGKILYSKNADAPLPIASMTKMMSQYLVHEAVEQEKIKWDSEVTVSEYAHKISQNTKLSNVPLELGGKYTVKELYEALSIYSANGATIALAEFIAGSETNFVKMMNEKGKELKLGEGEYQFINSTGLNNKDLLGNHPQGTTEEAENLLSASASAKLAYELLKRYPNVLETSKIPTKIFQEGKQYPVTMKNWNWMLPELVRGYEGMDGLKTGSTDTAGYCFTGTAKRGDFRLISVVIGSKSYEGRFADTRKLMDYGFNNFELKEVVSAGSTLKDNETITISKAKEKEEPIETKDALVLPVKKGVEQKFTKKFVPSKKELVAPLKKDTTVGTLQVTAKEEQSLGYITGEKAASVEMIVTTDVDKANVVTLGFRAVGSFFGDLFDKAVNGIKGLFS